MTRRFLCLFSLSFTLLVFHSSGWAAAPSTQASSQPSSNWRIQKAKSFPFWRVEVLTKDNPQSPLGVESTKAIIKDPNGNIKAEMKDTLLDPDPKENIQDWVPGTLLDVDKDGYEDLVLKGFSAGAHCCHTYQIYSLGKVLKKLGDLKLFDCGEQIKLQDLDGQGPLEIITCNARFAYLKGIPYSASPLPPQVFGIVGGSYKNLDKQYLQIFDADIAEQKKTLAEGYDQTAVIQIVLDYLLSGREEQAWQEFESLFIGLNKEARKQELKDRWNQYLGIKAESTKSESQATSKPSAAGKLP